MKKTDDAARGDSPAIQVDKRRDRRFPKEFAVQIYWLDESADLRDMQGVVKDISAGGFGIDLARSFVVGQLLSVGTSEGALQCEVCHVRQLGEKVYRLGMRILSASDGSNHKRSLKYLAAATSGDRPDES